MRKIIILCDSCPDGHEQNAQGEAIIIFGGRKATVDICEEHGKEIVDIMELGVVTSWKAGSKKAVVPAPAPQKKRAPSIDPEQAKHIREWAAKKGLQVNPRGRIRDEILAQYEEAHP